MVWLQQLRYLNEQISGGPEQYLSSDYIRISQYARDSLRKINPEQWGSCLIHLPIE